MLAIITLAFSGHHHARQIVCSLFIMIWGARLSGFLLFRILKTGKDDRFDDKRDKFFPFLGFWVFQMLWVWVVSLPVTILNSPKVTQYSQPDFGTGRDIAGVILYAIGLTMESVSDIQKYRFKILQKDKGAVCNVGFFSVTRHPNYFGEILIQFCEWLIRVEVSLVIQLTKSSYLHDRSITCRRQSRPKELRALRRALRIYSGSFLPHSTPHVPFRVASTGTSGRQETIRIWQQLGRLQDLA